MATASGTARTRRRPDETRERILAAVSGYIQPTRVSFFYQLGLFFVAAGLAFLLAVYVAMILLVGYGVFLHATSAHTVFGRTRGLSALLTYFGPIAIGGILVLFMVKPILARGSGQQQPRFLKPEVEKLLYEYVALICRAVHAPMPRTIRVDCEVNAAASFRRGMVSLFGDDLTLIIGLPIVAGLTLRQFTGVLGHEFGHFSQGTAMRLWYFVGSVNGWFARVVYERDQWDDRLIRWSKNDYYTVSWPCYAARGCVWLTRQALWSLMLLGDAISCYMTRQMEFDADLHQTRLVGSRVFAATSERMTELSLAYQIAMSDLSRFWGEERLVDSLPAFVVASLDRLTPEIRRSFRGYEQKLKTGLFDTHPVNRERIAKSMQENAEGIFDASLDELPATVLFSEFHKLSKVISLRIYREILGPQIEPHDLHPVEEMLERRNADNEAAKSLVRYFQVRIAPLYPLPIGGDAAETPKSPKETAQQLKESRAAVLKHVKGYRQLVEAFEHAESTLLSLSSARAQARVGLPIKAVHFKLSSTGLKHIEMQHARARAGVQMICAKQMTFETEAGIRLSAALQLLHVSGVVGRIENGKALCQEVKALLPSAQYLSSLLGELPTCRILWIELASLTSWLDPSKENPQLTAAIVEKLQALHLRLSSIHEQLGNHPYPLDHARKNASLREVVLPQLPEEMDLMGTLMATESMFGSLVTVQNRMFARLARAAELVETALGIPPLDDPDLDERPTATDTTDE